MGTSTSDRAQLAIDRCRDILAEVETVDQEVRLLLVIGGIEWRSRRFGRALAAIEEALRLCSDDVSPILRTRAISILGWIALAQLDMRAALAHFTEAADTARRSGWVAWQGLWLSGVAEAHLRTGALESADVALQRALPLIDQAGSQLARSRLANGTWAMGHLCGDAGRATNALADLERVARRGSLRDRVSLAIARALEALERADVGGAQNVLEPIQSNVLKSPQLVQHTPLLLAPYLRLGRFDEAQRLVEQVREHWGGLADATIDSLVASCNAQLHYARGDYDAARAALVDLVKIDAGYRYAPAMGMSAPALDVIWVAAEEGRCAQAQDIARQCDAWLNDCPRGLAVRARWQFAREQFTEALDSHIRYMKAFPLDRSELVLTFEKQYRLAAKRMTAAILPRASYLPSLP